MHPRVYHGINEKTTRVRFFVDDAHLAGAKPLDGDLLAAIARYEFIRRLQGFNNLVRADSPMDHPLSGVMSIGNAHRPTLLRIVTLWGWGVNHAKRL
jgi:hypothetical protein